MRERSTKLSLSPPDQLRSDSNFSTMGAIGLAVPKCYSAITTLGWITLPKLRTSDFGGARYTFLSVLNRVKRVRVGSKNFSSLLHCTGDGELICVPAGEVRFRRGTSHRSL